MLSPRTGEEIDTMMPARRERLRALLTELELLAPEAPELDLARMRQCVSTYRFTVAVTARSSAARARLLQRVSSDPPRCQGPTIYYEFPGMDLQAMFGRHLVLHGVAGAGNSMKSCGWFGELTSADFIPSTFSPDAKRVELVTDAKFELYARLKACK